MWWPGPQRHGRGFREQRKDHSSVGWPGRKAHLFLSRALLESVLPGLVAQREADRLWDETSVHVWEVATGKRICLYQAHRHPRYGIRSLAWSLDGAFLVSGSDDCTGKHGNQTVHVWNARTGETLFLYDGHEERTEVRSVSWSPDGTRIASGGGDDTVQIWSAPLLDLRFSSGEGRNE